MSDIIQNLVNDVLKDGARPTKYRCEITLPNTFTADEKKLDVICKATSFPTKTNEVIMVKFRGRNIPVPGQERFTHILDLTFYLDAKHKYKILFEEWAQALNYDAYQGTLANDPRNLQDEQYFDLSTAKTSILLTQLNFDGDLDEVTYEFHDVFPKETSQVNMSSESVSAVSEFTASFAFSYYTVIKKKDGVNSDDIANNILKEAQGAANAVVSKAMGYLSNSGIGKKLNSAAETSATKIQDSGKAIGTTIDEFLG
jgi:hypothetical protein